MIVPFGRSRLEIAPQSVITAPAGDKHHSIGRHVTAGARVAAGQADCLGANTGEQSVEPDFDALFDKTAVNEALFKSVHCPFRDISGRRYQCDFATGKRQFFSYNASHVVMVIIK